jgi:hypothetical protein
MINIKGDQVFNLGLEKTNKSGIIFYKKER